MQDLLKLVLRSFLRLNFRGVLSLPVPPRFIRIWTRILTTVTFRTAKVSEVPKKIGVAGHLLRYEPETPRGVVLFLHGGAYMFGSNKTHQAITSALAKSSGAEVFVPDYRLSPEHPYPAAVEDALETYRSLLEHHPATEIAIAGDSAGGGLTVCTALALRQAGLPPPACLALISPWVDLSQSGVSVRGKNLTDPLLSKKIMDRSSAMYRAGLQAADPRISPLFAKLNSLPPVLIHVASDEVLLSDSERLHARLQEAGVDSTLRTFAGLWHDFQLQAQLLDEADESLQELGQFVRSHITATFG